MDGLLALSEELAAAVQHGARSTVAVHGRPRMPSTGVHWRAGLVVTASHTVRSEDDVSVELPGGGRVAAVVAGRDAALDVAVLKVDAPGLAVADVGDSDAVRAGHVVLALGAGPRASWGIVSSVDGAHARGAAGLWSLDLTLYPGFSGGPLVAAGGRVVGLNTSGSSRHLQLAIPGRLVAGVVDEVVRHGRVPQAYLGVATQQVRVPDAVRESLGRADRTAVIVVDVPAGSPAAGALVIGDVILSLDGAAVTDPFDLRAALRARKVGDRVTASVLRGGRPAEIALVVGDRGAAA